MIRAIFVIAVVLVSPFAYANPPSIGTSKAVHYELASIEIMTEGVDSHIFSCAASSAVSKDERAQTMIKVLLDIQKET